MRTVRLARIAAQAELLLVRRIATTLARRAVYGALAAIFALSMLVCAHIVGALALIQYAHLLPIAAVAIVLGVDFAIALLFGLLAAGKMPDPVADEARRVRDQSLEQARQSLTLAAMLAPASRLVAQTGLLRVLIRTLGSLFRRSRATASL